MEYYSAIRINKNNNLYESPENDAELKKKKQSQNVTYSIILLTNILKKTT